MANTRQELQLIHTRKLARPGQKYYRDDGQVFIGTDDRRLRLLDKSDITVFKFTDSIPESNVQSAVEYIDNKLNLIFKQTEVDFGTDLYKNYKIFTIIDPDIKEGNIVIAQTAYDIPSLKSLDELEMDPIICYAGNASIGQFDLIVRGLEGSLTGKFKINYTIKWQ